MVKMLDSPRKRKAALGWFLITVGVLGLGLKANDLLQKILPENVILTFIILIAIIIVGATLTRVAPWWES